MVPEMSTNCMMKIGAIFHKMMLDQEEVAAEGEQKFRACHSQKGVGGVF